MAMGNYKSNITTRTLKDKTMKKTVLIIFFSFATLSCKGQEPKTDLEKKITTKTTPMFYIPKISSNFEKFDFKKTKEEYIKNKGELPDSETRQQTYRYEEKINNNEIVLRIYSEIIHKKDIEEFGESYPLEYIYYDNSPFEIRKTFYPNGNIKEKGLYILQGNVYKGMWYYFDENGKLTHTIDNDKPYKFTWEDIAKFMVDNNIPILLGYKDKFGSTDVNRASPLLFPESSVTEAALTTEKPVWSMTWKGETFNQYYSVTLDGENGKMLYRSKYWLSQEGEEVPKPIIEDFTK